MTADLRRQLIDIVGPNNVKGQARRLEIRPGAPPEVAKVLAAARAAKVPVAPIGTGSLRAEVGEAPQGSKPTILLDTRRMTNVLHIDELSLTVHAQAGIELGALESILEGRELTLGDLPAETYRSTLGGVLAARAPGRATGRLGPIESACVGLSAVLADGRLVHIKAVPRRATGPDLARLFLGSEGILGIVIAATLRLQHRPSDRTFLAFCLPTVDAAIDVARAGFRRGVKPSAIRVYDAIAARSEGLLEDLAANTALLVATVAGRKTLVAAEERILRSEAETREGRDLGDGPAQRWWNLRGEEVSGVAPTNRPWRFAVAAPLSRLAAVYRSVRASLLAAGSSCDGYVARFHDDGACLYFAFRAIPELEAAAREAAVAAGGRPASELGVDEPLQAALRALKHKLDPDGLLYPGRLL